MVRKSPGIGEKTGGRLLPRERTLCVGMGVTRKRQLGGGWRLALIFPDQRQVGRVSAAVASSRDPRALGEISQFP